MSRPYQRTEWTPRLISVFTLVMIAGEEFFGFFDAWIKARVVDPKLAGIGVYYVRT